MTAYRYLFIGPCFVRAQNASNWFAAILFISGCLCTCIPVAAQAQQRTVSGFVRDAETGEHLARAAVYDRGSERGVVTNAYGFFSLSTSADSLDLTVSFLGYASETLRAGVRDDLHVVIELTPTTLQGEEVVVSDERSHPAHDGNRHLLTTREIVALPALLGESDVLRTLQYLPGVKGGTEGTTALLVRGGGPDQNLILLDGAVVYNPAHLFGLVSTFNPDVIQSVNMITGGFPARFGGRLSSVVEVTTREGDRNETRGSATLGPIGSRFTVEGPLVAGHSSFVASVRVSTLDLLQTLLMPGSDTHYQIADFNFKANHAITERSRLYLSLYGGSDNYDDRFDLSEFNQRTRGSSGYGWSNQVLSLRWTNLHNARLFSTATAAVSRYAYHLHDEELSIWKHGTSADSSSFAFESMRYRSAIQDVRLAVDAEYLPGNRTALTVGASLTHHSFRPGNARIQSAASGRSGFDSRLDPSGASAALEASAYLESDVTFSPWWSANVGVHTSVFSLDGTRYGSIQPRTQVRFQPARGLSLEATYSRMRQYVHLLASASVSLPTDVWVPAERPVRPQNAWQASIGVSIAPADGPATASIAGYVKQMEGVLEFREGADHLALEEAWVRTVEQGRGHSRGLEFLVRRRQGRMTGWIAYTLAESRRQFKELNGGRSFPYRFDRRHDLTMTASFALQPRRRLAATWTYHTGDAVTLPTMRYRGSFDSGEALDFASRNGVRLPPYHRLDLSYAIDRETAHGTATLTVGAYNVYSRMNVFYVYRDTKVITNPETGAFEGRRHVLKKVTLLPVVPFISYRTTF